MRGVKLGDDFAPLRLGRHVGVVNLRLCRREQQLKTVNKLSPQLGGQLL